MSGEGELPEGVPPSQPNADQARADSVFTKTYNPYREHQSGRGPSNPPDKTTEIPIISKEPENDILKDTLIRLNLNNKFEKSDTLKEFLKMAKPEEVYAQGQIDAANRIFDAMVAEGERADREARLKLLDGLSSDPDLLARVIADRDEDEKAKRYAEMRNPEEARPAETEIDTNTETPGSTPPPPDAQPTS